MEEVSSLPPLQLILAAWWDEWKRPSIAFRTEPNKTRFNPHPSHQVTILAAWWEEWKESTTPLLFTSSSITIIIKIKIISSGVVVVLQLLFC